MLTIMLSNCQYMVNVPNTFPSLLLVLEKALVTAPSNIAVYVQMYTEGRLITPGFVIAVNVFKHKRPFSDWKDE